MRILVACEESQAVTIEMRKLGHEAYSCDIQACSGGYPEWHIKDDATKYINGYCGFKTEDGKAHYILSRWDMLIAHPPCTYLTAACNRSYQLSCNTAEKVVERYRKRDKAIQLFFKFINADCERIAVENPMGCMNTLYRKPDQTIHPYYFAQSITSIDYNLKRTCLWLKGLPILIRPAILPAPQPTKVYVRKSGNKKGGRYGAYYHDHAVGKNKTETAKLRSKTFPGIARAMAEQWAGKITK